MRTKTYIQKPAEVKRVWHLVDANGRILGDVLTEIASLLLGKKKPTYTPNVDGGDYAVVINAKSVVVTRKKADKKMYYFHSGIPGGLREETFNQLLDRNPAEIIRHGVKGMLPKNKLLAPRMKRLRVFADAEHTYKDKFV